MGTGPAASRESVSSFFSRSDIAFLVCVSIFVFLQLFILPIIPVFIEGDSMLPVSNAMRILDGQVMYRDFFHLSPPGAEFYYSALFYIFGVKIWILNATIFALAVAQLILVFVFSKRLLDGVFVYLPTLLYFVIGFRMFGIDGSSRLFSVILVLLAAWIVFRSRSTRAIAAAGVLCGVASFFVQTRGLVGIGGIGLFLLWTHWKNGIEIKDLLRDWIYAGGSFLLVVFVTQMPVAYFGGFDNYFFANFTFLKDHYGSDTLSNTFAYLSDLPDLDSYLQVYGTGGGLFRYLRVAAPTVFFYALVPLTYVVWFAVRRRQPTNKAIDEGLVLLSILGAVLFIGASAPTALRLYHISIPAVIVFSWLLSRMIRPQFAKVIVACLVFLGVLYTVQRQIVPNVQLEMPAGRAAFLSPVAAEKFVWLMNETRPGEAVFEAQHPTFYFPLHLKNPTPFYLVRDNNYTPDFQVRQLMTALENSPPRFIIWQGLWSKEPNERKPGDNLAPLWTFIRTNYVLKKEFREFAEFTTNSERDIEFWEKKNR